MEPRPKREGRAAPGKRIVGRKHHGHIKVLGNGVIGPEVREKRPIGIPTFEDKILQRAVQLAADRRSDGTDIRGGVCGLKSDDF
ncbi:MAG: hypothetical protein LBQ88_20115, partial [Treponema sp.]|nr:hypothetical protein [Treponema sp.]